MGVFVVRGPVHMSQVRSMRTKAEMCDYQCDYCKRSFYTEKGLEHHHRRQACVAREY